MGLPSDELIGEDVLPSAHLDLHNLPANSGEHKFLYMMTPSGFAIKSLVKILYILLSLLQTKELPEMKTQEIGP